MRNGFVGSVVSRLTGYDAVRVAVGVFLLIAAGLKGHQLATRPVAATELLDSRWLLIATVEFELLLGVGLVAGVLPRPTWALATACFGLFTCVSLYKAILGHTSCGCFGRVPVNPWYTSTVDLAIVFSLLRWRPKTPVPSLNVDFPYLPFRTILVLVIGITCTFPIAFAIGGNSRAVLSDAGNIVGEKQIVVLDPEKWIGKRFPLLGYTSVGGQLAAGKWLVLLYHCDCAKCQKVIPKLPQIAGSLACQHLAAIEMPPYGDCTGLLSSHQTLTVAHGRVDSNREWVIETPQAVLLNDGLVFGVATTFLK